MLEIAEKKAQGRSIEWLQADMRVLEDVPTTDAVTLFSDSLCYLTDFEDVVSVFEAVYDHLEEGGNFPLRCSFTASNARSFPRIPISFCGR